MVSLTLPSHASLTRQQGFPPMPHAPSDAPDRNVDAELERQGHSTRTVDGESLTELLAGNVEALRAHQDPNHDRYADKHDKASAYQTDDRPPHTRYTEA